MRIKDQLTRGLVQTTAVVLVLAHLGSISQAQLLGLHGQGFPSSAGSEYFVGRSEGKPLITVNLMGGVRNPGVYHIPIQTNLSQLLSYAGGLSETASADEISIRTSKTSASTVASYDLNKLIEKNEPIPILQDNDTLNIPTGKDPLPRTALWIGIISGFTTIIFTSILIRNNFNVR